jgi:hypothetical protein
MRITVTIMARLYAIYQVPGNIGRTDLIYWLFDADSIFISILNMKKQKPSKGKERSLSLGGVARI